ncbi:MAG: hypothetical protein R6U11_10715, partial [Bacteroidales bacterium]
MKKSKLFFALIAIVLLTSLLAGSTFAVPAEDLFGVALYDQQGGQFYVKDDTTPGPADRTFRYGPRNNNWLPVAGNWDGIEVYG